MLIDAPSFVAAPIGAPRNFPTPPKARVPSPPPPPRPTPKPSPADAFELVIDRFRSKGLTRGQAIREAVAQYPDLHQAWLAEINV